MKRKIIITGVNSELKEKLVKLFLDNNFTVAISINSKEPGFTRKSDNLIGIPWNIKSPLSAKNLILECQNRLNGFDEAITILSFKPNNNPIHEISSSDIEYAIDSSLKGNIFLLKELILYFQNIKTGNISLIHNTLQSEIFAPLYAAAAGGLTELTKSLFASYQNEQLAINSFVSSSGGIEEYAEYIFQNVSGRTKKVHGKIFKFQDRINPFSFNSQKR